MTNQSTEYSSTYFAIGYDEESLLDTSSKIQSYSEYPEGWCYGEGLAFSEATINAAVELNEKSQESGFLITDAFPGPNGDIKFTIYHESIYLEFNVDPNLAVTFVREEGDEETQSANLTLEEAITRIDDFAEEIWSSDFFLSSGTTGSKTVLWITHSNPPLTA